MNARSRNTLPKLPLDYIIRQCSLYIDLHNEMIWWELSSTIELLHGGAPALELCFHS